MDIIADMVTLIWPLVVLALFMSLPAHRAVIAAFVIGWLFLPTTNYSLPLIPNYSKDTATSLIVAIFCLLFDSNRLRLLRLRLVDLPIILFCASPPLSSLTNELGVWDAGSAFVSGFLTWGLPYLIGRAYFNDRESLRELAIGIFFGGLAYMPFCWFEIRMSPQLAELVYGSAGRWYNASRFGGWRPRVFMQDGLMLALWMAIASFIGICLWRARQLPRLFGIPPYFWVGLLTVTTILCRSTGALALLLIGLACLWFTQATATRLALIALLAMTPSYIAARIYGVLDGSPITNLVAKFNADRAQSFQFRLDNEDILISKAMQSPAFGWGGWGRSRVYDEWGNDISVTDGLWIQTLGANGLIGLIALYGILLLPIWQSVLFYRATPDRDLPVILALSIAATIYAIDCLPNSMETPAYMLIAGGLANASTFKTTAIDSRERIPIKTDARSRQPWPRCSQAT